MLRIPVSGATLNADLVVPVDARGLVLFAHGSGSGRHSHRNQFVARVLQQSDIATLLMDLLTEEEERIDNHTRELRFNIDLLAERLASTLKWAVGQPALQKLPIGLFGASTGAAAALVAAAKDPDHVASVVSRGGRPDLARESLKEVKAPNEQAKAQMPGEVSLKIVPRATHLFEEPGALAQVADFAAAWFWRTLRP
jgi:pimeloyl-ACP methyl ester carboxylesterase